MVLEDTKICLDATKNRDRLPVDDRVIWPDLDDLLLGDEASALRLSGIGGSDANIILSGDAGRILELWRIKRGEMLPEDLSDRLPVMLGCWTEAFNRHWYEKVTGQLVIRAGLVIACGEHRWRRCTLDGYVSSLGAVWEAKHTSAFAKPEEVVARYMPQLQHNMAVAKADVAILSVIFGNHKWELFEVEADWLYQEELLQAETDFWECVQTGREPVPTAVPPPPRTSGVREICFEGNNLWAATAADWLEHRDAAKTHASACSIIKSLVEEDVSRAFGHGIEAKRSKSGAITIRALKA